ncbi:DNA primase [Algibacter sp. PT7-4]|uniref:DNA primase n=1 Tax=Algibacter ulvanivorans TaxID=3400999 RepID=UPI003AB0BD71
MRYTNTSVDRVREADIVKTIGEFTSLKKVAGNYKCCSPFSEEKTPSFTVSPVKQIFKCFSTGLGGDGIKFVMQHKAVDFIEAIEIIAKIHNIYLEKEEVTPEIQRRLDQKAEMYKFTETSSRSFYNTYKQLPNSHWAKQIITEREFNQESILNFQIGFNGNENKLTKWAIANGTLAVAKELGLSKTKNNNSYDVFRSRIMFPIHNEKGTVVGFGGRQNNDPKLDKSFKYINSPSSLIYDKSNVLYGLFQAKHIINKLGSVVLTEGYTDVIAMHQNGCENTVASCGTALTDKHAQLLKKYADEVVLLRDGDKAGLKTMLKKDGDIDICLAHGLNVSICLLPDGEDPDTFSRSQLDMYTWIQDNKNDAVLFKASNFDLVRNRYQQDVDSMIEFYDIQIQDALSAKIDLNRLTADELKAAKATNKEIANNVSKIKKELAKEKAEIQKIDPYKKTKAVTEIAETLFKIKHEVKRAEYVKQIAKILKIPTTALKAEIGKFEIKAAEEEQKQKEADGTLYSTKNLKLPEGGSMEEYLEHGFLTIKNQFFFPLNGHFIEGTDFKFEPLFQIMGEKENKRLGEITNTANQKKIIEFDSEMLASFGEFRRFLFRQNGFLFYTDNGIKTEHFDRFVRRYNRAFEPALELLTMGWNKKQFFAFANGVEWKGKFRPVNKYGIMHLEGIDTSENEYNQKIDNYYSPSFSVMYKDAQEGDDLYENDRYFVYKQSAISLSEWMDKMITVFEDKAIIGILFNCGALFRDLFLQHYTSFPLLGGFGETGSGKSAFGLILQNFFYYRMAGVDLTQVTPSGLSKTLTRTTNTVVFCDEFQDKNIKEDVANLIMGGWNGNGRVKSKDIGSTRTTIEKILSAIYYCGQFMPTFKDGALGNRTIGLYFKKENRTSKQKENFTDLQNITNEGINSLICKIIEHRQYFEKSLPRTYSESERTLKEELKNEQFDERVFKNTSMLLTTFEILKTKINFPFDDEKVLSLCKDLILTNSEQISDSSGLNEFWNIITWLFEQKRIKDHQEFVITRDVSFKIIGEKRSESIHENQSRDQILYLRLKSVYQFYNKEATTREGVDVLNQTTLRNYFKSRPYFIGLIKGKRFGTAGTQSCYAFNYTMMLEKGLVTLEEDTSIEEQKDINEVMKIASESNESEEIPFA